MANTCKNYSTDGGDTFVVGGKLAIEGSAVVKGKLVIEESAVVEGLPQAAVQADSTAADVAGLKTDLNALLAKLKAAGLMAVE